MCFPLMNKQARKAVKIPDLAGGINYRDGITEVFDNQLTECKNMWFKDGVLRTRPASLTKPSLIKDVSSKTRDDIYSTQIFDEVTYSDGGKRYVLAGVDVKSANSNDTIFFYWIGDEQNKSLGYIDTNASDITYFVVMFKKILYCFVSTQEIFRLENMDDFTGEWVKVTEDELYAPIIITHAMPDFGFSISGNEYLTRGTLLEGFNTIGNRYRIIYSNCNPEIYGTQNTLSMFYYMAFSCADFKNGEKIQVNYTDAKGVTTEHYVTCTGKINLTEVVDSENPPKDNMYIYVVAKTILFKDVNTQEDKQWDKNEFIRDNVEIIAPSPTKTNEKDKVFSMTQAIWFGGASAGINGGTRLFLGGNTNKDEKSLIIWSDLNNPLYFPENNYFYVGNATSAVTAMEKQSDMLVIFKENETYFTQYHQNTNITADDLIEQSVIDIASSSAYFPLTLINPNIGCDLPDTVELCRNRLVWTNSNGKVYTLTSNNQYSERNIYEVGSLIERSIKKSMPIIKALACDWNGFYLLSVGNKAFLMDYNSNGYQYVYSFNKNEDAQKNIPWYEWELNFSKRSTDFDYPKAAVIDDNLIFSGIYNNYDITGSARFVSYKISDDNGLKTDCVLNANEQGIIFESVTISSEFTTKVFDFNAAGYRKNVDTVQLFLGNNGGVPIRVEFVTDCGTVSEDVTIESDNVTNYTAGYISPVTLSPSIRSIIRMGLRLSCEGEMAIDGATLSYRLLGGAR